MRIVCRWCKRSEASSASWARRASSKAMASRREGPSLFGGTGTPSSAHGSKPVVTALLGWQDPIVVRPPANPKGTADPYTPPTMWELILWGVGIAVFVTGALLYRRWHLHWGATAAEAAVPMPGDYLLPRAPFQATRAISIEAPPAQAWPWIVQIGLGRAGFYSYDLLDNRGRPSADRILPAWQTLELGAVAAPMANPPNERTSFRVAGFEPERWLLWAKPGSTWAWRLAGRQRRDPPRRPAQKPRTDCPGRSSALPCWRWPTSR